MYGSTTGHTPTDDEDDDGSSTTGSTVVDAVEIERHDDHSDDGSDEKEVPPLTTFPRMQVQARPTAHPLITAIRGDKLGLWKQSTFMAAWRKIVMRGGPEKTFIPCLNSKLTELNAYKELAYHDNTAGPITIEHLIAARDGIMALPRIETLDQVQLIIDAQHPKLMAYLDQALENQYGRNIQGMRLRWAERAEKGRKSRDDKRGNFEKLEILDILNEAIFYSNVSLKTEGKNSALVLTENGHEITLADIQVVGQHTIFKLGADVPDKHREHSIVALVDLIARHKQVNDSNKIQLTMGRSLDVLHLAIILLTEHHMHLDLSEVFAPMNKALNNSTNPNKAELIAIWQEVVKYSTAYDEMSSNVLPWRQSNPDLQGKSIATISRELAELNARYHTLFNSAGFSASSAAATPSSSSTGATGSGPVISTTGPSDPVLTVKPPSPI